MKTNLMTIATGIAGTSAVEATPTIIEATQVANESGQIIQVAIQIIIGIVTLFGLLKKKK